MDIKNQQGLGDAKSTQIKAAVELGQRLTLEAAEERPTINSPAHAAALVSYEMPAFEQEHLRVILLDRRNRITETVEVYKGPVKSSQVRVGKIFK